ncbi:MAG TPA: hypothetical protein VFZ53_16025 [Polyangiaceae bacterium]
MAGSYLVAACGGDGETGERPEETGGTSGTGPTGGTSGSGGSGGSGVTGGTAGSGGSGGSGGTDCAPCTPAAECPTIMPPADGIINNFENLYVGAGELPENGIYGANEEDGSLKPEWWLGYFSGAYAYPDASDPCVTSEFPLTRSLSGGELRVSGTVGTYSGFGTWLEQCLIDMSSYSGISFRIGGDPGPSGILRLRAFAQTNSAPVECRDDRGTCTAASCSPATYTITVPETPEVITVTWDDFVDGAPSAGVDPSEIWQFQWDFDWADGTSSYPVDITLDDVTLVP